MKVSCLFGAVTRSLVLSVLFSSAVVAQQNSSMPMNHGMQIKGMSMHEGMPMQDKDMSRCIDMMKKGLGPADSQYDLRFIDEMIQHHQGALQMSKDALSKAHHQQIKTLAQQIINGQEREINQLKQWRSQWYGKK